MLWIANFFQPRLNSNAMWTRLSPMGPDLLGTSHAMAALALLWDTEMWRLEFFAEGGHFSWSSEARVGRSKRHFLVREEEYFVVLVTRNYLNKRPVPKDSWFTGNLDMQLLWIGDFIWLRFVDVDVLFCQVIFISIARVPQWEGGAVIFTGELGLIQPGAYLQNISI